MTPSLSDSSPANRRIRRNNSVKILRENSIHISLGAFEHVSITRLGMNWSATRSSRPCIVSTRTTLTHTTSRLVTSAAIRQPRCSLTLRTTPSRFCGSVRQFMPCALTATRAFTVASTRRHRGSPTRHIYGAAASVPTCALRRSLARSNVSRRRSSPVSRFRSHRSALRCTTVPSGGSHSLRIHDFSTNLLHVPR
jgi:hypothetical protein